MNNIFTIEKTKSSPKVVLNYKSHLLSIEGQSYPENAYAFYKPVLDKVKLYLKDNRKIEVKFRLIYINTSSHKLILDLIEILEEHQNSGDEVQVKWYCDPENDVAIETGEEIQEDSNLSFEIIEEE